MNGLILKSWSPYNIEKPKTVALSVSAHIVIVGQCRNEMNTVANLNEEYKYRFYEFWRQDDIL